jgi:tetratricopeptide (TPR) repeat protein
MTMDQEIDTGQPLAGRRIAFVGKLGGLTKRDAQRLLREHGAIPVEKSDDHVDLIVVGADELPLVDEEELLDDNTRKAVANDRLEIITETQLWQRLGLVEGEQEVRRLYTPAMLADLSNVPLATIRRWHRRGLILPVREVHKLPYFDFQEVATARRLAQLLAAGASPAAVEKKLAELSRYVPDIERPLAQLSVIVEGKQILLRQGEGLIEPGGQLRIDFDALESHAEEGDSRNMVPEKPTLVFEDYRNVDAEYATPDEMVDIAAIFEDEGELPLAADWYRAAMSAGGPKPDVCFQLAEVLYRLGDLSAARERYFMAIELFEDFVEARANLGCVLVELGQLELAIAAFKGALKYHNDYPDVHFHLARALDELGKMGEAESHWRTFVALAADSPWADEARMRLGIDQRSHQGD